MNISESTKYHLTGDMEDILDFLQKIDNAVGRKIQDVKIYRVGGYSEYNANVKVIEFGDNNEI